VRDPYLDDGDVRLYLGDVVDVLREMDAESVQTCVTSPPYWGLRDYGTGDAQIGLEASPGAYVARMVQVFREVRRVLRDDGTLWLNLGDSYATGGAGAPSAASTLAGNGHVGGGDKAAHVSQVTRRAKDLKPKDLLGIPWRVAFALQADGWYLRSDIVWAKPNPMPESVTDRPTKAHEYLFLLTKAPRYFYDADAIREAATTEWNSAEAWAARQAMTAPELGKGADTEKQRTRGFGTHHPDEWRNDRNARSVWTITTKPYAGAHFATFPPELPERCIKAGTAEGDLVLDPFSGSGTTAFVARTLARRAVGIDLNAEYLDLAAERLRQLSLFGQGAA